MSDLTEFDKRAANGRKHTNGMLSTDNPDPKSDQRFIRLKDVAKNTLTKRQLNYLFNNDADNSNTWWDIHEPYTYKNNSYGFRFDKDFKNFDHLTLNDWKNMYVCLGCSWTYGIGMQSEFTWPARLSTRLGEKCLNLGVPGTGIQTSYRILEAWVKHFGCAPKGVFILGWLHPRLEFSNFRKKNNTEQVESYYSVIINAPRHSEGIAFGRKLLLEEDATRKVYTNTLKKFAKIKREYDIDIYRISPEVLPLEEFRKVTAADISYIGNSSNVLALKGYGFDFSHPPLTFQVFVSVAFKQLLNDKDKFII